MNDQGDGRRENTKTEPIEITKMGRTLRMVRDRRDHVRKLAGDCGAMARDAGCRLCVSPRRKRGLHLIHPTIKRTHRRGGSAAPKTLKTKSMETDIKNTAAPSVEVSRLVRPPAGFRGWLDANGIGCRTIWERHISGACILREAHDKGCSCSYCKSGEVGLILPANKGRNSWRAIRWKWRGKLHVLRWTLPKWWPNTDSATTSQHINQNLTSESK